MTPTHFSTAGDDSRHHPPPHQLLYHVPQHSRREKLRFAADEAASSPAVYYAGGGGGVSYGAPPYAVQQAPNGFSLSLSSPSSSAAAKRPAVGPYGPFTGYAAVLGRSRFLGPAQRLMQEICDQVGDCAVKGRDEGVLDEMGMEVDAGDDAAVEAVGPEEQWRKTRLLSLMEEVCRRYKQYIQQVQAVLSSFETVAGLSTAAPHASAALKAMAKHFKALKLAILAQLRAAGKAVCMETLAKVDDAAPSFALAADGGVPLPFHRTGGLAPAYGQPQSVWRPQRGLPDRAVTVLRGWLFEHFLHPYPSDTDKQMLAKQTGLTRNQVSNWFINARVRLWKPMVEEIHNLEMRQLQKPNAADDPPPHGIAPAQHSSDSSAGLSDCHPGEAPHRIFRDDLSGINGDINAPINLAYGMLPGDQSTGVGGFGMAGGSSSVSLTLGLQQNNRSCLIEPLAVDPVPASLVRRFGLDDINDSYMVGSFEGQHRHFMGGGQLLRDLVG